MGTHAGSRSTRGLVTTLTRPLGERTPQSNRPVLREGTGACGVAEKRGEITRSWSAQSKAPWPPGRSVPPAGVPRRGRCAFLGFILCKLTFPARVPQHRVGHHDYGPSQYVGQHEDVELLQALVHGVLGVVRAGGRAKQGGAVTGLAERAVVEDRTPSSMDLGQLVPAPRGCLPPTPYPTPPLRTNAPSLGGGLSRRGPAGGRGNPLRGCGPWGPAPWGDEEGRSRGWREGGFCSVLALHPKPHPSGPGTSDGPLGTPATKV